MFYRFLCREDGTTAAEYGLIGVLIVVATLGALTATGTAIEENLYDIMESTAAAI